jgi:uncharacterized membrane protein YkgB
MLLLGQVLVIAVLLGILSLRWLRPDAWAQTFFKVLWWLVASLLVLECLMLFGPRLMPS